jgi:hypothetical protein
MGLITLEWKFKQARRGLQLWKIRVRIGAPLLDDTPVKALVTVLSIAEEIEHSTHILLSTAIDNEEMILIYNNRKILIHFFPPLLAKEIKKIV